MSRRSMCWMEGYSHTCLTSWVTLVPGLSEYVIHATPNTHTHALPYLSSVTRVLYVHAGSSVDCIKYHSWKQESSAGILVKYVSLGSWNILGYLSVLLSLSLYILILLRCYCLLVQMVIDANLVPTLIFTLSHGEFKTQKEAAWAVSNFTVGGTPEQVSI